jgi:hypothetical protein
MPKNVRQILKQNKKHTYIYSRKNNKYLVIYWNDILDKNLFYNSISAHKGASFVKRKYSPREGYHSFHIRTTSHKFLFLYWTNRKKSQRKRKQIRPLYSYLHRWNHQGKVYLSFGNFEWCKFISLEWFFSFMRKSANVQSYQKGVGGLKGQ